MQRDRSPRCPALPSFRGKGRATTRFSRSLDKVQPGESKLASRQLFSEFAQSLFAAVNVTLALQDANAP